MLRTQQYWVAIGWLSVATSLAGAQTLNDPALMVTEVASGLSAPTAMAFIGPNDILALQKNDGWVRRVLNGVLCELWLAWRGGADAVAEDARALLALIERETLGTGLAQHRVLLHWAEGVLGDPANALRALRTALAEIVASAHVAERAAFLELAADLALRAGDVRQATAFVDDAFAHLQRTGERYMLPRLWARRAQIAERTGDAAVATRMRERERQACIDAATAPLT